MVARCTSWAYVAAVLSLTVVSAAAAKYSGGTGEPNDPYQIATAADLIALGETPADYDKHFLLTADIDLDPNLPGRKVFDRAVIAADTNDMADWVQGTPFTGVFNGNGHAISRPTIAGKDCLGLFGHSRGEVRDLGVVHVNVTGSDYVGGLVGANSGSLTRCYSTGAVSGDEYVGGLAGQNNSSVFQCYSTGAVAAASFVGGLVAQNDGSISQCHYAGTVNATGERVGGLVGVNYSIVNDCYCTGAVEGDWYVGGLVGDNDPPSGPVEGHSWLGYCYCTAKVSGKDNVGPLVGGQTGGWNVMSCFYETQTPDQVWNGLTRAEMQTAKTFLNAEWDFVGETANGSEDIWKIAEGLGYPRLAWEKYSGGTGEPNDPYKIATAADLIALGETPDDYDKHFILIADIDLDPNLPGRKVFDRAVIAPDTNDATWRFEGTFFIGVFDGSGHTISHLKIIGGWSLGVFGRLKSAAQIRDLGVVDVSVAGSGGDVGGLAGYSEGDLTGCYSTGVVSADERVGGLIGENEGRLSRCYSTCEVAGRSDVGGLIGSSEGEVTNCYSTSTVSGERWVGGLLGRNDQGNVTYCHSIGPVSGIGAVGGLVGTDEGSFGKFSSSFWDTQTSGQTTTAGGIGKTTAEMQTQSTFTDAGWDFVGETDNGTEDIWWIDEGKDYPRLWWEDHD